MSKPIIPMFTTRLGDSRLLSHAVEFPKPQWRTFQLTTTALQDTTHSRRGVSAGPGSRWSSLSRPRKPTHESQPRWSSPSRPRKPTNESQPRWSSLSRPRKSTSRPLPRHPQNSSPGLDKLDHRNGTRRPDHQVSISSTSESGCAQRVQKAGHQVSTSSTTGMAAPAYRITGSRRARPPEWRQPLTRPSSSTGTPEPGVSRRGCGGRRWPGRIRACPGVRAGSGACRIPSCPWPPRSRPWPCHR